MSLLDTLNFREVREISLSPSAQTVACVVRHADLAAQRNVERLVLLDVATRAERTLYSAEQITRIAWSPDEDFIYGMATEAGAGTLLQLNRCTAAVIPLWSTSDLLGGFALSPDGSFCLVSTTRFASDELQQVRETGAVFQWGRQRLDHLIQPRPDPVGERFVRIRTNNRETAELGEIPFEGFRPGEFVRDIAISPDNRSAVVQLQRMGDATKGPPSNFDLVLLDLASGIAREVQPGSPHTEQGGIWLGSSTRFFFASGGKGRIFDVTTGQCSVLDWLKTPIDWLQGGSYDMVTGTLFLQLRASLLRLNLPLKREEIVPGFFSSSSFSADHAQYAFLHESLESAPEIALAKTNGRASQILTRLNPELESRSLAHVEEIFITNTYGTKSNAFLVYPIGYQVGRRYPLILASYGFRGRFLTVAEWHSTFPVQTLSGQGYAVLLVNLPPLTSAQQLAGNPVKAREHEGWQVLSTFESAIRQLTESGFADPDRLGLYGWSHGAFVTEFLLAHSHLHFRAACVGEGGDYNPGEYWLFGTASWPQIFANTFGGPLTAKTAAAYLEFCPVLNVDRVKTPLLLEFKRETAMLGFEFYVPLRMLGVPAELVAYENEEHNFVRPTVRLASMTRKLDWFNYWMLGKEDPDPAKAEQYVRWRKMKTAWEKTKATRRKPDAAGPSLAEVEKAP